MKFVWNVFFLKLGKKKLKNLYKLKNIFAKNRRKNLHKHPGPPFQIRPGPGYFSRAGICETHNFYHNNSCSELWILNISRLIQRNSERDMALLAQASVQLNEIALVPDSLLCMSVCQCSAVQPSTAAAARRGGGAMQK